VSQPRLECLGDGAYAYLQPGGWGFSNAGLVTSGGASLLVDTLYDLNLTRTMLATMQNATAAAGRIDAVVNTHANGDHCWGNAALPDATIVASRETAQEMAGLSPRLMHTLVRAARTISGGGPLIRWPLALLGRLGVRRAGALLEAAPFVVDAFGAFDFGGVTLRAPTRTFEGQLVLTVGDKEVVLIQVGPAHTRGDTLVYVPADRVVFTGDILFIGSHPIMWEGPIKNWIRACDVVLGLDVDVVVPGHGPLTNKAGVLRTRDYWVALERAVEAGHAAGLAAPEIARALERDHWLGEPERLVVSVDTALRELSGQAGDRDPLDLLAEMARFAREAGGAQGRTAQSIPVPSSGRGEEGST
jgi:glyoxylase-like metal-dependent hydrolase (beta-lactamase superfamily II)